MTGPVGIYVHLPYCPTKCAYCDFNAYLAPGGDAFLRYAKAVSAEVRLAAAAEGQLFVGSIYFGGGTPSLFPVDEVAAIFDTLREVHEISPDAEISLEANPSGLTAAHLCRLREAGVNRLSIGAQSFSPNLLQAIGRDHGPQEIRQAVALARQAGIPRVSLDLMYGLPGETDADVRQSVDEALSLDVRHVSAYALELEPATVFGRRHARGELVLPDEDAVVRRGDMVGERLERAGLFRYEVSNFARPGERCRHNWHTWQRGRYRGFGAGAHSFMGERRFWNVAHPARYEGLVARGALPEAGGEDVAAIAAGEWAYLALRTFTLAGISFEATFGVPLVQAFPETLAWACREGWVTREGRDYVVRPERRWLLGRLAARFLDEGRLDPPKPGLVPSRRLALDSWEC